MHARDAGVHRRPDCVDVRPRPHLFLIVVLLRGGITGGIHRPQARCIGVQRLPRCAEIEQYGCPVHGDVNVGRLDIEVQQLVGVDFAQAVEQMGEQTAHKAVGKLLAVALNVKLQGASAHVLHDHVDRFIGAEKILHAHDVGMGNRGERPALFEKTLQPVAKHRQVFIGIYFDFSAVYTNDESCRQVLFDRHRRTAFIAPQVDDRKTAR